MGKRHSYSDERPMDISNRITVDPEVMFGKPVIRGTRITVESILDKIAADIPIAEILQDYPRLVREDVLAAVAYARLALSMDEIIPGKAS